MEDAKAQTNHSLGTGGVCLKQYEKVIMKILPLVEPKYDHLPPRFDDDGDWPFNLLPRAARVWGDKPGQLKSRSRAARKEGQVRNMLRCVLRLAPADKPLTIVDFGGGSGHLGIPLALLLPNATVFVVDLRKRSLNLMHEKADLVVEEIRQNETTKSDPLTAPIRFDKNNRAFSCCGRDGILSNLHSFHGPVEAFKENFDLAIALHLCGEATDVALRLAGSVNAAGVVVAPCCVGKLSTMAMNPDVYNATGSNEATVTYPQSSFFRGIITDQEDWDALAKAADYNSETGSKTHNSAPRRTAKALIETDRRMFLEELYRYSTALMRMDPWDLTPKNDILVAWNPLLIDTEDLPHPKPDMKCSKDIEVTKAQFLVPGDNLGQSEWTKGEETEIVESIQDFLDRTRGTKQEFDPFIFPTRMGGHRRKLVHFVANKLKLSHWCVGSKAADKTVAVARMASGQ